MIYTELGDIRALTLIRVVLERTEDEELRTKLEEYLQNNEELWRTFIKKTSMTLPPHSLKSGWQVIYHKVTKLYHN